MEVKKLHNKIANLQAEEEKALKRIEETRAKAQQMLEFKISQEENLKERENQKLEHLTHARNKVLQQKEFDYNLKVKLQQIQETKKFNAQIIQE